MNRIDSFINNSSISKMYCQYHFDWKLRLSPFLKPKMKVPAKRMKNRILSKPVALVLFQKIQKLIIF